MTVRLAVRAQGDLRAIIETIGGNDPIAARRFEAAIVDALERIDQFPRIGRMVYAPRSVRAVLLKRWGYQIFYVERQHGTVTVFTVRSAKMKPMRFPRGHGIDE